MRVRAHMLRIKHARAHRYLSPIVVIPRRHLAADGCRNGSFSDNNGLLRGYVSNLAVVWNVLVNTKQKCASKSWKFFLLCIHFNVTLSFFCCILFYFSCMSSWKHFFVKLCIMQRDKFLSRTSLDLGTFTKRVYSFLKAGIAPCKSLDFTVFNK